MNQDKSNITNIDQGEESPDENWNQSTTVDGGKAPNFENWASKSLETNQSKRTLSDTHVATTKYHQTSSDIKKSKVINIDTWDQFTLLDKIKSQVRF